MAAVQPEPSLRALITTTTTTNNNNKSHHLFKNPHPTYFGHHHLQQNAMLQQNVSITITFSLRRFTVVPQHNGN
jgi:hypothetical protein